MQQDKHPFNPAVAEREAMRRIRQFINRAAAQHLRAMRRSWVGGEKK